jgi:hypothetical protein
VGQKDRAAARRKVKTSETVTVQDNVNSFVCGNEAFKTCEKLCCVYTNADSFMNKLQEFKLRYIDGEEDTPDVIAVTEVMAKNVWYKLHKAELSIPGYDMFPDNFPPEKGRGVVMYVKQELKAVEVHMDTEFHENVWVSINLADKSRLLLGCIYKSPSSTEENHRHLNQLLLSVSGMQKTYNQTLIVGDFNFPGIDWTVSRGRESIDSDFIECIRDCYFEQIVDQPTRFRVNQRPSILDLVLVSDSNRVTSVQYDVPLGRSDHGVLKLYYQCQTRYEVSRGVKFNYFKGDYAKLCREMTEDWDIVLDGKNTEEMEGMFMNNLIAAMDSSIPRIKNTPRKGKTPLSAATVKCIRRKHRLWTRYMETRDDDRYREYCKARNKVKTVIRKDRKEREKQIAESSKSNSKNFWKYVNSKRKSVSGVSELHTVVDGQPYIANSDEAKADVLANFFSSVFTAEPDGEFEELCTQCESLSSDDPFSQQEVNKLLKNLDTSKSPGPDQIHPKVLYELADVIDAPLTRIFNSSFESGTVPKDWRIGQITALFKKGSKTLPSNYRPVSLTSVICKTMEKLIRKRIVDHMNEHELFSPRQFGFMSGRSTTLQLLRVMDHWTEILDNGGVINTIYMDFMKAFDKVPHRRLLSKLKSYGLNTCIRRWIQGFLSERKQRVHLNGHYSSWREVTSGIPQGSVLGPILFVIYINDLPSCVLSDIFLFADDTKVYREIECDADQEVLQRDLHSLFDWSERWLLCFHPDKCKVLQITNKRKSCEDPIYYMNKYDGGTTTLEVVKSEKDIGVTIDQYIAFDKHIQLQVNKANQLVGIIRRTFDHLEYRTFCLLFKALVRPHLEYAGSVWSPHKICDIESIENVQRRATKMLPHLKDKSYEERLRILQLPTLKYRRLRGDMIETFKILNKVYDPRATSGLFNLSSGTTRGHSLKVSKERCRLDVRKHFFTNRVVDTWNSLPDNIVTSRTVHMFENRLDRLWRSHPMKEDYTVGYGHRHRTPGSSTGDQHKEEDSRDELSGGENSLRS